MGKPNYIVILTDDQGYGDLSCMGSPDVVTPYFDSLAEDGVRFTDWYANAPVCSPTRASLLTGRYPGNCGVRSIVSGHRHATGLNQKVPTIAKALKELDYNTGIVGKWHLGVDETSRPSEHGFDYSFTFLSGCIDYYSHIFYWGQNLGVNPRHDLFENNNDVNYNGEYATDLITRKAVSYIRENARKREPFFLYLGYNAPHYPMHAPQEYIDRFSHLPPDRRIMAAMISAVDDGIGEIRSELERQGITEDTCIFFQSDNGPSRESRNWLDGNEDLYYGGSTGQLKGHKFSLFEGGIRVPSILCWPGKIQGNQVNHEVGSSMDIFPSFLEAAGGDISLYELDGKNIFPMVMNGEDSPHDRIFWEMLNQTAVRHGKWKLVLNGQLVEDEPAVDDIFLSDLENDIGEKQNLKDQYPHIAEELKEAAELWRSNIEKRWKEEWIPLGSCLT